MVLDARASADGVRAEGMELVSNLREMGDVLRANAERLLADIQSIHARMVGDLDRVEPESASGAGSGSGTSAGSSSSASTPPDEPAGDAAADEADAGGGASGDADALDVPDFIARQ